MPRSRSNSFTLIEILVSLFIMAVLMGVGFYTFSKSQNFATLQSATDDVKLAIETARNNANSIPQSIGADINEIVFFGVEFTNAEPITYQNFYVINTTPNSCDDINKYNSTLACTKKPYGESRSLAKGVRMMDFHPGQPPTIVYDAIKKGAKVAWCSNPNDCPGSLAPGHPDTRDIPIIDIKSGILKTLTINCVTGLIYEQP